MKTEAESQRLQALTGSVRALEAGTQEFCDSLLNHRLLAHLSQAWSYSLRLQDTQGLWLPLARRYFISLHVIPFPQASFPSVHIKDGNLGKRTERNSGWALVTIFDSTKTIYEKRFLFRFW